MRKCQHLFKTKVNLAFSWYIVHVARKPLFRFLANQKKWYIPPWCRTSARYSVGKGGELVSEDVDKICRAILYQLKTAKNLEDAIDAVEVIAGAENVAVVNDKIAKKNKARD